MSRQRGDPLLSVRDLRTYFHTREGIVRAVDGISFDVHRGETVCLVGESGSGNTVSCESITGLVPTPPGEITSGEIEFDGRDLTALSEAQLRGIRGDRIAHVFQNPGNVLDPVYTIGAQLIEAIRLHRAVSKRAARERAITLLDRVGLPKPAARIEDYPHEFSGGMKQRVVIAMALSGDPDLLIADEPTTALDVTIEAEILRLLKDLQRERELAILFVTHDLGVVAEIADRVVVTYAGKVMERADVYDLFERPAHPYTQALLRSLPGTQGAAEPIGGSPADPLRPPEGCRFHPRCPHAIADCATGDQPPLFPASNTRSGNGNENGATAPDQRASCVFYDGEHGSSTVRDGTDTSRGSGTDRGTKRTGGGEESRS
ncbi:peptide ABC transporter ATP-binding protein [Halobacteriales archaeon QH_8_64_26]|nr:MAG: peptide ABC transporter ATP-binding protein [Halobacteriales archaeon QH_8_64_26]